MGPRPTAKRRWLHYTVLFKRLTAMLIREIQLELFTDREEPKGGGLTTCSIPHDRPRPARYRVYFKNGNCRDVCQWCVFHFKPKGKFADKVDHIEKLKK